MEASLKRHIEGLLAEAELVVDERANGLMDRADFQQFIGRFVAATRSLMEDCERLEHERDEYAERLNRRPHMRPFEPMDSAMGYGQDVAQSV